MSSRKGSRGKARKKVSADCAQAGLSDTDRLKAALESAEQHLRAAHYGLAFAFYLVALQIDPGIKARIKKNFTLAFQIGSEELMSSRSVEELLHCHQQASQLFPECEGVLNIMGTQLFRLGYADEAATCFRKALRLNPELTVARTNLDNVRSHLVERWHFPMLNDRLRNNAFKLAISKAVARGHTTVLDIGAGTGILSIFAAAAGAEQVVACEMSKTMYEVAQNVLHVNNMTDKVHLIHKESTELVVPVDLASRVSLVVTETLDAGIFGEGILTTLHHAWQHLLLPRHDDTTKIQSQVIPAAAVLYACLVECEEIRKQSCVVNTSLCGLDLTGLAQPPESCNPTSANVDLYNTAPLGELRGGVRYLSDPCVVAEVSFNDIDDISQFMNGSKDRTYEFVIKNGGHVDAVVAWFDLHLDADISLSTAPVRSTCWEQVVCPLRHSCIDLKTGKPWRHVNPDDVVHVAFSVGISSCISMRCVGIARSPDAHTATMCTCATSMKDNICQQKITTAHTTVVNKPAIAESPSFPGDEEIYLMNDAFYHDTYSDALFAAVLARKEQASDASGGVSVLDITRGFSLLSLLALRNGGAVKAALCSRAVDNTALVEALTHVGAGIAAAAEDRRCGTSKRLSFFKDIEACTQEWDVVVVDPIESCGSLRPGILEDIALARLSCLQPGGIFIPRRFVVRCVCASSMLLSELCRVIDDERTLGLHISALMNDYQMGIAVDLDMTTLPHEQLSDSFAALEVNLDSLVNSGLSALQMSNSVAVSIVKPGTISAVLYWFDLHLNEHVQLNTADPRCHWKQAAALLPQTMAVKAGDVVKITTTIRESCLSIVVE